jgi:hypothetical protein
MSLSSVSFGWRGWPTDDGRWVDTNHGISAGDQDKVGKAIYLHDHQVGVGVQEVAVVVVRAPVLSRAAPRGA